MPTIHDELNEALRLLDNATGASENDGDRIGLAELALKRVLASLGDTSDRPAHIIDDETGIPIARKTPATTEQVEALTALPEGEGRSEYQWMRLRDGTLALVVFPQEDTYLQLSDSGVCDFWD